MPVDKAWRNVHITYPLTSLPLHISVETEIYSDHHCSCCRLCVLTYSMVQSPSWEPNRFAASQEIPRISRKPKVHYSTHKRPQWNQLDALISQIYFWNETLEANWFAASQEIPRISRNRKVHYRIHKRPQWDQLDALISQIYFWNETLHVSGSSSVHHEEFFTVRTAMVYVIQVCWQLASRISKKYYSWRWAINAPETCRGWLTK